jgi:hypothetical protein
MSNAELADAITAAYNRAGTANEDQRIQQEHLKALLAVQLGRAQAVVADYSNAPNQARLQPSPEAGCSVCHAKLGHHDDPRPHHCLLQAGHEGRHFCHICGLYWDTPNAEHHARSEAE